MGMTEFQSEIKLEIDDPPTIITKDTCNRTETTTTISDDEGHKNEHSFSWILTRVHAGYFRITLSLCSQALLWKSLLDSSDMLLPHMLKPLSRAFILLWSVSLFTLLSLSLLYMLRCCFHFKMVKAEFLHHVGVNYLFAPFISWLLLLQSSPFIAPKSISYFLLWCVFVMPLLILDVKIYGQWFTKGKRYLSVAANPTSQISVIGNLVGARSAAEMGWNEGAVCLFSLGIIHYLVLFVTLYQRLTGNNNGIPALLRPVFFLFIAAPSMASLTWDSVSGSFGTPSKMLFFLSVFLFTSLVCRPTLFKKSMKKFSVTWWAYSYPLTVLAMASMEYAREVKGGVPDALMFTLLGLSVLVFLALIIFTAFNSNKLLTNHDSITYNCISKNNVQTSCDENLY
ncbi:hypothetical protein C5167_009385 [Papaver somniferum]|uniref:Uncharacterized protein n=1 Tax=Papaver somniferum TaxID=3469 RepID=A0A4Y7K0C2_PAPSO|nr:S-type anion channel SLAH1-like [Papaver somniferum]RZC65701.1 hypothetical protein C5167_009385 [Papaver somniferum]